MFAILIAGISVNAWLSSFHRNVLGYATDMSIQSLLTDTNNQREQNGEIGLNMNNQLDTAAQAKANDMAAKDYWSHNTPSGQTPWSFITGAGYNYTTAGENLAYGFDTADDTVAGWMNSPEHRANILSTTYKDVGFGFVNIPNYQQSGPETLVVAMYASPASVSSGATAKPQNATPRSVTSRAPSATASSSPTPVSSTQLSTPPAMATTTPASGDTLTPPKSEPAPQRISRIQLVSSNTPVNVFMLSVLVTTGVTFLVLRHVLAWRKVFIRGERFILRHPLIDTATMALIVVGVLLSHTAGLIR